MFERIRSVSTSLLGHGGAFIEGWSLSPYVFQTLLDHLQPSTREVVSVSWESMAATEHLSLFLPASRSSVSLRMLALESHETIA